MDPQQKIALFREMIGGGADADFAQSMLAAHDWDVQAALNTVLGESASPAPAPRPLDAEGYRAPMRTGYTDTLMAPANPEEERRRQLEREAEELARLEAQRLAQEHARHEAQARQVEQQRLEAERQALERRRQRQAQDVAQPPPSAVPLPQQQLFQQQQPQQQHQQPQQAQPQPQPQQQQQQQQQQLQQPLQPQDAHRQQVEMERLQKKEAEELLREKQEAEERQQREAMAQVGPGKAEDGVVQAIVALRKRYKDSDLAGLRTCLQTLRVYINNLARNPHDAKFQRINSDNNAFRTRVAAYEGAVAVLIACGFQEAEGALVVGPDFVKTKGSRLWDALTKIDVMLEQLKGTA